MNASNSLTFFTILYIIQVYKDIPCHNRTKVSVVVLKSSVYMNYSVYPYSPIEESEWESYSS